MLAKMAHPSGNRTTCFSKQGKAGHEAGQRILRIELVCLSLYIILYVRGKKCYDVNFEFIE